MTTALKNLHKHVIAVTNQFWDDLETGPKQERKVKFKSKRAEQIHKVLSKETRDDEVASLKDIFSMVIEEEIPRLPVRVQRGGMPTFSYGVAVVPTGNTNGHNYPLHFISIAAEQGNANMVKPDGKTGNNMTQNRKDLRRPNPKELANISEKQLKGLLR